MRSLPAAAERMAAAAEAATELGRQAERLEARLNDQLKMVDPVLTSDGFCYEREAIEVW